MRLYNTLTRREEEFVPADGRTVRMYTCGLTVYARGHIGNFRTFVSLDVLRRALTHQEGYAMRHVMNFTDVDDKTIKASDEAGVSLREYTDRYIAAFREDAAALGLEPVEENPARDRRSRTCAPWSTWCSALDARGHTYRSDGSIYFRIATLPDYGKLARLDHDGMQAGARVDADTYAQAGRARLRAVEGHQAGRADVGLRLRTGPAGLAHRVLGHGAAPAGRAADRHPRRRHRSDLSASRERDRAGRRRDGQAVRRASGCTSSSSTSTTRRCRSRSATSSPCATFSSKGYRASALRYLLISVHYRKQLTFNWDVLAQAEAAMTRLADFLARVDGITGGARASAIVAARVQRARDEFRAHIADDLNVPGAQGVMFELVRDMNAAMDQGQVGAADARVIREAFDAFDQVLGVLALRRAEDAAPPVPADEIERLIEAAARGAPARATSPGPIESGRISRRVG